MDGSHGPDEVQSLCGNAMVSVIGNAFHGMNQRTEDGFGCKLVLRQSLATEGVINPEGFDSLTLCCEAKSWFDCFSERCEQHWNEKEEADCFPTQKWSANVQLQPLLDFIQHVSPRGARFVDSKGRWLVLRGPVGPNHTEELWVQLIIYPSAAGSGVLSCSREVYTKTGGPSVSSEVCCFFHLRPWTEGDGGDRAGLCSYGGEQVLLL